MVDITEKVGEERINWYGVIITTVKIMSRSEDGVEWKML